MFKPFLSFPYCSLPSTQEMSSAEHVTQPRIILDTDLGVDDAQALLMALTHSHVEAITTVFGNVPLEQATRNATKLLHEWGFSHVPVFVGASHPVTGPASEMITASHIHGETGLGTSQIPDAGAPQPGFAPEKIVELVRRHPGEITLIAIGPLTNIALALRLEPALASLVKRFVFLGGCIYGRGNITTAAEFNVFCDPEGAAEVFRGMNNVEMISWEPILDASLPWDWVDKWMAVDTPRGRSLSSITRFFYDRLSPSQSAFKCAGYPFADPMAVAAALRPDFVTRSERRRVEVECKGEFTRGQTVIEWRQADRLRAAGKVVLPENALLVLDVDKTVLAELLMSSVTRP
jgi:purine nucleosidase